MTETIGQYLKRHREEKNITLDAVVQETHIRLEYLRALESDNKDLLPSDIQGKGFLRLYAEMLNLDSTWLLNFWDTLKLPGETSAIVGEPAAVDSAASVFEQAETSSQTEKTVAAINEPSAREDALSAEMNHQDVDTVAETSEQPSLTSAELLQNISNTIKTQRKLLQLSLLDVEALTHIRHQNLAAMEENQFDALPSSVQGKGMLQSYAEFLNLDAEEILLQYAEALQQKRSEKHAASTTEKPVNQQLVDDNNNAVARKKNPLQQLISPDVLIGSGLIVVIVVVAILSVTKVINTNRQMNAANLGATETSIVLSSATITPTPTLTPSATANPTDVIVVDPQSTTSANATIETTAINTNARLQLHLIANQRSYLKVTADDEIVFEGRVAPGNAYQFFGDEFIEIVCGNAAAISAVLKQDDTQTDLGTLGTVGQVIRVRYQPDQIITPTSPPTMTPTNTNTPVPTMTPEPT